MNKDMHLIRACELAAICTYHQIGKGDKEKVDDLAVIAMREVLNNADFSAEVIVGEGVLDEAPMLYIGEKLGKGTSGIEWELAVDPVESTSGCAYDNTFSGAVIAAARKGSLQKIPEMYMTKFFVSSKYHPYLKDFKFNSTKEAFIHLQKESGNKELVGICLDRERNKDNIDFIRKHGGKVTLIQDGDVLAAIDVINDKADFVFGSGGSPEGATMAALANANGGIFYCRFKKTSELFGENEETIKATEMEAKALKECGLEFDKVYSQTEICNDDKARFVCTSITTRGNSSLIPIRKEDNYFHVNTIFVSHGITRQIQASYKIDLVMELIPSVKNVLKKVLK